MKTFAAFIAGLFLLVGAEITQAQVGVSISIGPPAIPVYVQPPCPADGYLWTPGYWAYDYDDNVYYWVPGVWIAPPEIGFLWTPGYWGFVGGHYFWHAGYWGPHVGFYGGINYGFGYVGTGFYGGRWEGGAFRYNTTVWHVNNTVIHNTYTAAPAAGPSSRASFNGAGGITAQPTAAEKVAMNEHHLQPTASQQSHERAMSKDKNQWASVNKGKPATTAMSSVNGRKFNSSGTVAAKTEAHTSAKNNVSTARTSHHSVPSSHATVPANHRVPPTSHYAPPANHSAPPTYHAAPQRRQAPAMQHNVAPQHPQGMRPAGEHHGR
jgi:hypothetical protein